jgi:hypothetical protein
MDSLRESIPSSTLSLDYNHSLKAKMQQTHHRETNKKILVMIFEDFDIAADFDAPK